MTPASLTNADRIEALEAFGYTEREAAFLTTAALHGGYFFHRQYCGAIGKQPGGNGAALIEKLLTLKHASVAVGCNNTKLYHLCSRPFYLMLGEEDNRNRRQRPPFAIKNRIMGLDFVLGHPANTYLATEREKVEFFTGTLGIDVAVLPTKHFVSQKSKTATDRYFVDKYPLFLTPSDEKRPPLVSFCYVDEGLMTGSRFGNHLLQYRSLMLALGRFQLIYVAAQDCFFRASERDFNNFVAGLDPARGPKTRGHQQDRLIEYFKARTLYEARQFESFDRAGLIQLRNGRDEFAGPHFDDLFQKWKAGGEAAIPLDSANQQPSRTPIQATFSTHLLRDEYDFFAAPPRVRMGPKRAARADDLAG